MNQNVFCCDNLTYAKAHTVNGKLSKKQVCLSCTVVFLLLNNTENVQLPCCYTEIFNKYKNISEV